MLISKKKPKRWKRPDYEFHTHLDIDTCVKRLSTLGDAPLSTSRKLTIYTRQISNVEWAFDARWTCNDREWVNAALNIIKRSDDLCYGLVILYPCKNPRSFWVYVLTALEFIGLGLIRIAEAAKAFGWLVLITLLVLLPIAYEIGRKAYEKRHFYQIMKDALVL